MTTWTPPGLDGRHWLEHAEEYERLDTLKALGIDEKAADLHRMAGDFFGSLREEYAAWIEDVQKGTLRA